jgi:hypothetical protein
MNKINMGFGKTLQIFLKAILGIMLIGMVASCHSTDTNKSTAAQIRRYRPIKTDEVTIYMNGRMCGVGDPAVLDVLKLVRLNQIKSVSIKLYAADVFKLELSTGSEAPEPHMSLFFKYAPQVVDEYNKLSKEINCSVYTSTPVDLPESQQESLAKLRSELDADIKNDLSVRRGN